MGAVVEVEFRPVERELGRMDASDRARIEYLAKVHAGAKALHALLTAGDAPETMVQGPVAEIARTVLSQLRRDVNDRVAEIRRSNGWQG